MKTFTTMAGSLGVLLLVLAVLGLGISPVSAAAGASSSGNSTALHGHGAGHHFAQNSTWQHTMQGTNLTQFHTRGANVNTSAAAFRNTTHEQKGLGFAPNATMQQERLQAFVTNLQKKGVDVSALQTAIQNNDTAAEKTWLTTYVESHKGQFNNTTRQQWHPWNATESKSA